MARLEPGERLYEGKAKIVHRTADPDVYYVYFKDDATAFNAQKRGTILGKGAVNNRVSEHFFGLLEAAGIPTHFIERVDDRAMLVRALSILPLEIVVRNVTAGSLAKRLGLEEGIALRRPVLEHYYKNDALGDPMVNRYHALAMGWATEEQLDEVEALALRINDLMRADLAPRGIDLIDFKLEFGTWRGRILLGDEISPDTCRFWDSRTREKLDKDRFRRDLGGVEEAYAEVLRRVTGDAGAAGAGEGAGTEGRP